MICTLIKKDEPGKPGNAEVVDWDADHADITWTKPENDGGSPITGYMIEYKVNLSTCVIRLNITFLHRIHNNSTFWVLVFFRRNLAMIGLQQRNSLVMLLAEQSPVLRKVHSTSSVLRPLTKRDQENQARLPNQSLPNQDLVRT